ncbi:hypothetical protein D3C85_871280 [compost metagenome]
MSAGSKRIKHPSAAQRALCALVAQDQRIALHRLYRRVQQDLRKHPLARRQARAFQQSHASRHILSADMHVHGMKMLKGARFARQ